MDGYLEDEPSDEKVFMLAGEWSEIEKCRVFKDIVSLGGRFIDSVIWNNSCTHVIAKTFTLSEKIMGAIAAGRWVVTRRFIHKSVKKGDWVKARAYVVDDVVLYHRRQCFSLTGRRRHRHGSVFRGMKVVFLLDPAQSTKKEVYTRIVHAGGGEVIGVGLEAMVSGSIGLNEITHVVVDPDILEDHHSMAETFRAWMEMVQKHELEEEGKQIWHVYYKFLTEKLQRPGAAVSDLLDKFSIFNKDIQHEARRQRIDLPVTTVSRPEMTPVIFSPVEDYPLSSPGNSPIKCPLCWDDYTRIISTGRSLMSTLCGHLFCSFCLPYWVKSSGRCATCRSVLSSNDIHPIFL